MKRKKEILKEIKKLAKEYKLLNESDYDYDGLYSLQIRNLYKIPKKFTNPDKDLPIKKAVDGWVKSFNKIAKGKTVFLGHSKGERIIKTVKDVNVDKIGGRTMVARGYVEPDGQRTPIHGEVEFTIIIKFTDGSSSNPQTAHVFYQR